MDSENQPRELDVKLNNKLEAISRKYRALSIELLERIKGQDQAILKFVKGCYSGELLEESESESGPRATFFFFGPSGVGKTYLAETAARLLNIPYQLFDMTHYAGNSMMTRFVKENPECLLIFDEIEKASSDEIPSFLQILNPSMNSQTDFSKAIIIFTSNAGRTLYENSEENLSSIPESVLLNALLNEKDKRGRSLFPSELCSRFATGTTIIFNHLKVRDLNQIIKRKFEITAANFEKQYGIHITYDENISKLFLLSQGTAMDARIASFKSTDFIKHELYELVRQLDLSTLKDKDIRVIDMSVDLSGADQDVRNLFTQNERKEYLVFADQRVIDAFPHNDQYLIDGVSEYSDVENFLTHDIEAIFIDPFKGWDQSAGSPLSVADYDSEGVRLFHNIIDKQSGIPVYILDTGDRLTEVDENTFIQEGTADVVEVSSDLRENFSHQFSGIAEELYMEEQNNKFTQRGWVLGYRSRQKTLDDGSISIAFYDLRKRMAVDTENRNTILKETEKPNIRFKDIIGAENAKSELKYYVEYLKNPKQFLIAGGKPPKGVLLYGPPGTGKTMLAKAMAGESDVTFLETSASEFMNKYIGGGEENIRKIFDTARKYAPSIIFIDEIDAIGKQRTGGESTATPERMLNTLLTEMDGFSSASNPKQPVFVLAATNYGVSNRTDTIASLDKALLRRFDNRIYVDLPDKEERLRYIRQILNNKGIDNIEESIIDNIAMRTAGQSLAIIQNILDLAFRNASKNRRKMQGIDLLNSFDEFFYGEKREHTPEYYWEVAVHEAGHAVMSYLEGEKPSYITIESRGNFGGYTLSGNGEEIENLTKEMLKGKIRISLAGRAAEEVFLGQKKAINTGASGDLNRASDYAFDMLCSYGMEEGQYITLTKAEVLNSPMSQKYVDRMNEIIKDEMNYTISAISEHKALVERIAKSLLEKNHMTGDEFLEIVNEK